MPIELSTRLFDVAGRSVTRHTDPAEGAYQRCRQYTAGQSIGPDTLPDCSVPVDVFLIG